MVSEEAIMICYDNSRWMCMKPYKSVLQLEALLLYSRAKIESNPKTAIGVMAMATEGESIYARSPTNKLHEIGNNFLGLSNVSRGGNLNFRIGLTVARLNLCGVPPIPPTTQKRILFFTGGPININLETAQRTGKAFLELGLAVDIVNFCVEEEHSYQRRVLDAFFHAVNNNNNSHIVHVKAGDCMRHVLSSPPAIIICTASMEAAIRNEEAKYPKEKNQADAYVEYLKILKDYKKFLLDSEKPYYQKVQWGKGKNQAAAYDKYDPLEIMEQHQALLADSGKLNYQKVLLGKGKTVAF